MKKIYRIALLLAVLILGSQRTQSALISTFENTAGEYTIENILNKFNVFSFNDVTGMHIVGPVIGKGALYNQIKDRGLTFSDYDQNVSSYIQGMIAPNSRTSSSYSKTNPMQYIGSVNSLFKKVYWGDDFVYQVNGFDYVNNKVEVIQTDGYVDWGKAKTALQNQSILLSDEAGRILSASDIEENGGIVSVKITAGETVTIPDNVLAKINRIQFIGSFSTKTIINIPSKENVILPGIMTSKTFGEYGQDMNLIINIPYSTQVTLPNAYGNGIGHIVAVNANVIHRSGNYNGGIIAANLDSHSEGHLWFYSGGPLIEEDVFTEVSGEKIWEDENDYYGLRPKEIKITLYANDKPVASQILTSKENWKYTFKKLPLLKQGSYFIREDNMEHYSASYDGFDIINTLQIAQISIKKEVFINQKKTDINETFYVAAFLKNQRISDVKAISTNQTVTFTLPLDTYSIQETDIHGNPVNETFAYQVTLPTDITLSETDKIYSAALTNTLITNIRIFKTDADNRLLEGAHLQILDENQNVIDEWISNGSYHEIKAKLTPLQVYILREKEAPKGYQKAADLSFTVEKSNNVQNIYLSNLILKDDIKENTPPKNNPDISPQTSDTSLAFYGIMLFISGISIILSIKKKSSR